MQIYISIEGQSYGPFTADEVRQKLDKGELRTKDYACYDNANWITIGDLELQNLLPLSKVIKRTKTLVAEKECCPKCGSDQWKLVKLVHEEGTQDVNLIGVSDHVSVGSGGVNVGKSATQTSGLIQSSISQRCARPEPLNNENTTIVGHILFHLLYLFPGFYYGLDLWFIFKLIISLFASALLAFLIGFATWSLFKSDQEKKDEKEIVERNRKNLEDWKKRRICLRCGKFFDPKKVVKTRRVKSKKINF